MAKVSSADALISVVGFLGEGKGHKMKKTYIYLCCSVFQVKTRCRG